MIYHNLKDYIPARNKWEQEHSKLSNGKINGIPIKEFYKVNPKPRYEVALKQNPDGTQIPKGIVARK